MDYSPSIQYSNTYWGVASILLQIRGLLKKYWDKFLTVEAPIEYHGIPVYQTYLKAAEKLGKPLFIWGANDKDSIQKLINDGVAGIMTDRPDLF